MPTRYRRPTTPEERQRAERAREDKLAAMHATLTEQVQALATGPQWQRWLDVASRFHNYSFNNTLLLLAQKPDATHVAGYSVWRQLGRQVNRGESGLVVFAPVTRRATGEPDDTAAVRPAEPPARRCILGYRPTYVWDISQTSGNELPEPPMPQLLAGQAPGGLWEGLTEHCRAAGFSVRQQRLTDGTNGYTDFGRRLVVVRSDVDDAQAVKTLAHELGHVLLHNRNDFADQRTALCRDEKEVEAESVAYLVTAAHGLDTADYTFAYVAGWAASTGDVVRALRTTAERVLSAARQVLAAGPESLEELVDRTSTGAQRTAEVLAHETPTVTLPSVRPAQRPLPRDRLVAANAAAAAFFTAECPNSWAPGYMAVRLGWAQDPLPSELGYAPAGWTQLTDHLRAAGFTGDELLAAGLAALTRDGRALDRFRDRLMFPLLTAGPHGDREVVGFIGRRNPSHHSAADGRIPKYLNTSDTPLFTKGKHLYGLAQNADRLASGALAVLVEGPLDALAVDLASRGSMAGVAPLGTAFTEAQAAGLMATLRRGTDRIVVATDADPAGRRAAAQAYHLLTELGADPRGAALPAGMDPAQLAEMHGPAALVERLAMAEPLARQVAIQAVAGGDLRWAETQVTAARAAADVVMRAPAGTWQRELVAVATQTGIKLPTLQQVVIERLAAPQREREALGRLAGRDHRQNSDGLQDGSTAATQLATATTAGARDVRPLVVRPPGAELATPPKLDDPSRLGVAKGVCAPRR